MGSDWRPAADLDLLQRRAGLLAQVRAFFAGRGVLEVATPLLSAAASVDLHLDSWQVLPAEARPDVQPRYLHTSPEFAMKRLLAAGSGPIYQICQVFRDDPCGRLHNPEFCLLEWYRPGFGLHPLMDEVEALLRAVGGGRFAPAPFERLSYREAVQREAGLDPMRADPAGLRACLQARGVAAPASASAAELADRDFWLDLLVGLVVGPRLGLAAPCFVYDYPASQAALARIRPGDPPVAERFELYWQGIELANGFHELTDAAEQRRRFAAELQRRRMRGRATPPPDENLLAALAAGLPDCAGVALGLDRLLMLLAGRASLDEVLVFPWDRA